VEKVYTFEPVPEELNAEQAKHILGGQAQLWGELIADQQRREFMAFPRACALSEVLWSPKNDRKFRQFLPRLAQHLNRLKLAGVNYRRLDANYHHHRRERAGRLRSDVLGQALAGCEGLAKGVRPAD